MRWTGDADDAVLGLDAAERADPAVGGDRRRCDRRDVGAHRTQRPEHVEEAHGHRDCDRHASRDVHRLHRTAATSLGAAAATLARADAACARSTRASCRRRHGRASQKLMLPAFPCRRTTRQAKHPCRARRRPGSGACAEAIRLLKPHKLVKAKCGGSQLGFALNTFPQHRPAVRLTVGTGVAAPSFCADFAPGSVLVRAGEPGRANALEMLDRRIAQLNISRAVCQARK